MTETELPLDAVIKNTLLVSILLPIYNGELHIEEALTSCFSQSYENLEIIIIDDGSTDRSIDITKNLISKQSNAILCHHSTNEGVSAAWNTGLENCQGDWVLRLAQDDVLEPFAVDELLKTALNHPHVDVIYSDMWNTDENLQNPTIHTVAGDGELFKQRNGLGLCVMISRDAVNSGVRYQSEYQAAEDLAYFTSLYDKGFKYKKADTRPLMLFRHHQQMGSFQLYAQQQLETAQILCQRTPSAKKCRNISGKYFTLASYHNRNQRLYSKGLQIALQGLWRSPFHFPLFKEAIANLLKKKPNRLL